MPDQDRLNDIMTQYQQALDEAAQAAVVAAAESKQRELVETHPDLAEELQKRWEGASDVAETIGLGTPATKPGPASLAATPPVSSPAGPVPSPIEPQSGTVLIGRLRNQQLALWQQGRRVMVEQLVDDLAEGSLSEEQLLELIYGEVMSRQAAGELAPVEEYALRFPDLKERMERLFEMHEVMESPTLDSEIRGDQDTGNNPPSGLADTAILATIDTARGSAPHTDTQLATDIREFGDYQLLEEIARGGMGVVYRARQVGLDRTVALKMIRSGELAHDGVVERFHTEARAAAKLEHSGILPVHEIGECDGQHFFTMAFIEGGSLQDRLREGPLPPRQAAEIVRQTAEAMQHAHENGIVHRDLKPANILLDRDGQPKVADFGLAKRLEEDSGLTASGTAMGTPSYMPPEQALGKAEDIGALADVYSLGAVLYCLLTGRPPFAADNYLETIKQVIDKDAAPPRTLNPAIPKDLETICLKCLRKEQRSRYQSAAELADDLQRCLNNEPIKARRVGRLEKSWLWCKRRPVVAGLLATVVLVAGIGSGVFVERMNASHAQGLVDSLVKADVQQVSALLDQIEEYSWWTKSLLQNRFQAARENSTEKVYLRLALLRSDVTHLDQLTEDLLNSDTRNFQVLRDELAAQRTKILDRLWTAFRDDSDEKRRFRAGLALAHYDPDGEQWTAADATFLVDSLLSRVPEEQPLIRRYLVKIKTRLYVALKRAFSDPKGKERRTLGAAIAFAEFAVADVGRVADLAAEATPDQFHILYSALEKASAEPIHQALRPVVSKQPDETLSPAERVIFGKRRAGAAIALLRKGDREQIFDALRVAADPEPLSQFVHRCKARGVTSQELLECLDAADKLRQPKQGEEREVENRVVFALLLALGEFRPDDIPDSPSLIDRLADWYAADPSSTIHGACGWLLRHWGKTDLTRKVDQTPLPYSTDRQWYTIEIKTKAPGPLVGAPPLELRSYMTFVVIQPGTYWMGTRDDEPNKRGGETRHQVTITRPFAILDREVTWEDLDAIEPSMKVMKRIATKKLRVQLDPKHPFLISTWYESVSVCRGLTRRIGFGDEEQAYPDPSALDKTKYPPDPDAILGLPRDWPVYVQRRGFRLPTEAEWEVACRAGTMVSWSHGSDAALLDRYAHYLGSGRSHYVRSLRPNLRGLFDMHGNVQEWCHDWESAEYEARSKDPKGPERGSRRVARGGAWLRFGKYCRSGFRESYKPHERFEYIGLRVAQSLPVEKPTAAESECR